jgi:hypothetical protein
LRRLARRTFRDPESLIRLHELLLFIRAYPHNAAIARLSEEQLRSFPERIAQLLKQGVDLSWLEHPEVSGIAGTSVTDTFSFYIVRWLTRRYPSQVDIYWDWFEDENRLAATWPRFMPLLEEDAAVEANVPYREWLAAARGRRTELPWLIDRFDELKKTDKEKAELYDSQQLYVRWTPRYTSTRTGMRVPTRELFFHDRPLIQRRDVNLREELEKPPPRLRNLSRRQGERAIELAREASTVRYRELYGFTHGDPAHVYGTNIGRGVEVFLIGLPPEKRLPLRAYHAAMIYKNGVPVGYFEGLSLFERMESGFNLYYTFRDGETAWLYARILNLMHHFAGVTAFALDPYQIGYENEEGIESGAFWFYRKLGFRPTDRNVLKLVEKEEEKLATRDGYRTPARVLRKLAASPMVFELDEKRIGDWDRFQIRNVGFRFERAGVKFHLPRRLRESKAAAEETTYLEVMRQHKQLRREIIRLGSEATDQDE